MNQRFYYSSAGFIIDTQMSFEHENLKLARMKESADWNEKAQKICAELNANPRKWNKIIKNWASSFEVGPLKLGYLLTK